MTLSSPQNQINSEGVIRVRGARTHNLKGVDLDIPRGKMVVVTGPSGSGKSTLAIDTIFAEGQRQYLETLSIYVRQFLPQLERPAVDVVDGLPPTLCIDQRPGPANPRSTVATVTEIYDYIRLLLARVATPRCYQCDQEIQQQSEEEIGDRLLKLPEGTRVMILAPMVRGRKGSHEEVLARIRKIGLVRLRVDGQILDIDEVPNLEPRRNHSIEAVVDRIIIKTGIDKRLQDAVSFAARHGEGRISIIRQAENGESKEWVDELFSTEYACANCGISYEEIEPRTFSFNSPYGACQECGGLGSREQFDPDLLIPDTTMSVASGAITAWKSLGAKALAARMESVAPFFKSKKLTIETPFDDWSPGQRRHFMEGDRSFEGLDTLLEKDFSTCTAAKRLAHLETLRGKVTCKSCNGSRLRQEANHVFLGGRNPQAILDLTIGDAIGYFDELDFTEEQAEIAVPIVEEILKRLRFLNDVSLSYLKLNRAADTLSGGERQRVRLATSIGCGLVGVCYILDEPSIGLHPRDNDRLIQSLRNLQELGNTVLVVEHDEAIMRQSDMVIDVGPEAGLKGGRVVALGSPSDVAADLHSPTGRYLSGIDRIEVPATRRKLKKTSSITLEGVTTNNLADVTVRIPLGGLVCVTGVSGSGKSSLIGQTLTPALGKRLGQSTRKPGPYRAVRGLSQIDKLIEIDQQPIGRSQRSTPATYAGILDEIRKVFAETRDSRRLGFKANRFSFNAKDGRCEACEGYGVKRIEMSFLPDLFVMCEACRGQRYNPATLQVRYRGHTIADVLDLSIEQARDLFENFENIKRILDSLKDIGLGYVKLGQPSSTLSGGEAQRIKLATELARPDSGHTLYVLDEPTTGLHFVDVQRLLDVLGRLVDKGNSVLVIEHHLDVIKCADWLIDLGPEGGSGGGEIVAEGRPEEVAEVAASFTGQAIKEHLSLHESTSQ